MSAIRKLIEAAGNGPVTQDQIDAAEAELAALALHSLSWKEERDRLREQVTERDRRAEALGPCRSLNRSEPRRCLDGKVRYPACMLAEGHDGEHYSFGSQWTGEGGAG